MSRICQFAFLVFAVAFFSLTFTFTQDVKKAIEWQEGKGVELEDKKKQKDTLIFDDIDVLSGKKLTSPVMIYFFFPKIEDEKKAKKDELKQFKACELMEKKIFADKEMVKKSEEFICVKINIKDFPKSLKEKYKVKSAPLALFFDCLGKKVWKLDNPEEDLVNLLIQLGEIVSKSDEAKEKAQSGKK